ncbi:MAG TPA: SRPBCC family protein [Gaiellaceae bacterium]
MAVVTGERSFAAPPERVFDLLIDPDVVVSAIPAVRDHRVVDESHWEARIKLPVPLAPKLTVRFEVLERRSAERASLRAHGAGAEVASTFELAAADGGTAMTWRAEIHLSGALDRLVGGGLDAVARRQAERTLDAVERALA